MNEKVMFSHNSDEWATPQDFYDKLNAEFNFTLDPCSDGVNNKSIAVYECEVGDIVIPHDDKFVTNRIKPVKRLYREDVIRILNGEE